MAWFDPKFATRALLSKYKTKDSSEATHLALNGGMWNVPFDCRPEFYQALMRDRNGEVPFFFTEKRGPIFAFYLDLDYGATKLVTDAELVTLMRITQSAVRCFYPDLVQWVQRGTVASLMCSEPTPMPAAKTAQHRDFIKTGIHLIMPSLYVDEEQAVALANYIIQALMREWPHHPEMLPWPAIVDLGVYKNGGGLRMMGSSKCDKCPDCSGRSPAQQRDLCTKCRTLGYILQGNGRVYYPQHILQGGTAQLTKNPRFLTDWVYTWGYVSILCSEALPTIGFRHPVDFVPIAQSQVRAINRFSSNEICATDPRCRAIQRWIQSVRPEWSQLIVSKLTLGSAANSGVARPAAALTYLAKVIGPGSTYCLNVGRTHKSSTIYFNIGVKGLRQRCFSEKAPPGGHPCKGYASIPIVLTDLSILQVLFPDDNQVGADLAARYANVLGSNWAGTRDKNSLTRRQLIKMRLNTPIPPPKFRVEPIDPPEPPRPAALHNYEDARKRSLPPPSRFDIKRARCDEGEDEFNSGDDFN